MNANISLAIALLFVAVTDTILANIVLPMLFKKQNPSPKAQEQQRIILKIMNLLTYVFLFAGIAVYLLKPLRG